MRIPATLAVVGGLCCSVAFLTGSWPWVLILFTLGHCLFCTYYAPLFTSVQSDAPPEARAQLTAIVLVLSSSLGVGVGPTIVGMMSDALAPTLGKGSLGVALSIVSLFASVAGVCMLLADRLTRRRALAAAS